MTVDLTQEDIQRAIAQRRDNSDLTTRCPIAQALRRLNPEKPVTVALTICRVDEKAYDLPYEATMVTTLSSFEWEGIIPFTFEMEPTA